MPDAALVGLIVAGLLVVYLRTLAPGITWANGGGDSGDFAAAAATGGVPHPSGYPTYMLLARLFIAVPLGEPAVRTNLLSAVAGALAAGCVYVLVRRLLAQNGWHSQVAAGLAALAFGLSPLHWSQAVITEVYALHALFAGGLWLLAAGVGTEAGKQGSRGAGVLAGLALGNHLTIGLVVAAWFVAVGLNAPRAERLRRLGWCLGGMAAGLLVYFYLPLAAASQPAVSWGDARDPAGFWWVVSGAPYRGLAFGLEGALLPERVSAWAGLVIAQFGPLGLLLGLLGLLYGRTPLRRLVWLSVVVALLTSLFAIGYRTGDSDAYLIPAFLVFATWIGLGAAWLLAEARRVMPRATPLVVAGLLIAVLWPAPGNAARVDASQDRRAICFAETVLAQAPSGAIILTQNDFDTFPLWYAHHGLGERPDVAVIAAPLLDFAWYRAHVRHLYPRLSVPEQARNWSDVLREANPGAPICWTDAELHPLSRCS